MAISSDLCMEVHLHVGQVLASCSASEYAMSHLRSNGFQPLQLHQVAWRILWLQYSCTLLHHGGFIRQQRIGLEQNSLVRQISLSLSSDEGFCHPRHAIKLTNGNSVVSHDYYNDNLRRVQQLMKVIIEFCYWIIQAQGLQYLEFKREILLIAKTRITIQNFKIYWASEMLECLWTTTNSILLRRNSLLKEFQFVTKSDMLIKLLNIFLF